MDKDMAVSLGEIQTLAQTTKEKTADIYAAIEEMKGQIAKVIDGQLWAGEDAQSFKIYMMRDLGKAWSTAKWLEKIADELKAYVERTLESSGERAQKISVSNVE